MFKFTPEDFQTVGTVAPHMMCFQAAKIANNLLMKSTSVWEKEKLKLEKKLLKLEESLKIDEKFDNLSINGGPFK